MTLRTTLLVLGLACVALNPAFAQGAGQSVVENGRTLTVDCKGGYVRVDGDRNQLRLTGRCTTLTVDGNRNLIRVATVGSIVLTGNGNAVTWSKALKGRRPTVDNPGSRNSVTHR